MQLPRPILLQGVYIVNKPFNPVIPDYRPKTERKGTQEISLEFKPCIVCGGPITTGYFGRWGNTGTCNKKCEKEQEDKPKFLKE